MAFVLEYGTVEILNLHEHKSTTEMSLEFVNEVDDKTNDGIKIDHQISLNVSKASFLIKKYFHNEMVLFYSTAYFRQATDEKLVKSKPRLLSTM